MPCSGRTAPVPHFYFGMSMVGWLGVHWTWTYRATDGAEEDGIRVLSSGQGLVGQRGAGSVDGRLWRLVGTTVCFTGASTHTTEQVVLQVEGNITGLLDNAEDLKAIVIRIDMVQTDSFASMAHLDSLSSNLYFVMS